jgi:hypothetical protein
MSYESDAKFKEIVEMSIMGLLVQCEVCGEKLMNNLKYRRKDEKYYVEQDNLQFFHQYWCELPKINE